MRLIDADKLTEEWLDAENEPVYCANDVLSSIDEQPTLDCTIRIKLHSRPPERRYLMIKLFISQPMNGKTDDEILTVRQKMRAYIERIYTSDDGGIPCVKVIDSLFQGAPTVAKPLWFLGRSLQLMSTADVVVFAPGWESARGCKIEQMCAESYGLTWIDGEELLSKCWIDIEAVEEPDHERVSEPDHERVSEPAKENAACASVVKGGAK